MTTTGSEWWQQWLLGFRRVTSSTRYIPEVDGFRFVALACVFIFHLAGDILRHSPGNAHSSLAGDPIFWLSQRLNFGVQLFFAVSGFVLALPFARLYLLQTQTVDLRRYLVRRVTRLEPPYIIALCLFFCLKIVGARGSGATLLPHLLASLGYVHNLIYGRPSDINFVSWSLEIEVQFYLLAPLLAFLFFRPQKSSVRRGLMVTAILATAATALYLSTDVRIGLSLIGQLSYFLAGILLADVYTVRRDATKESWWGDLLAIGSAVVFIALLHNSVSFAMLGPLLVFAGYWGTFRSVYIRRILSITGIATIGGMCYSIYLLHNYVVACAGYVTEPLSSNWPFEGRLLAQFILLAPLVLIVSGLFFKLIEQPCMNPEWPTRFLRFFLKESDRDLATPRITTTD